MNDPQFRKRATIALAGALAVHEIAAGFFTPVRGEPTPDETVKVSLMRIEQRPRPTPTPQPTPRPTPLPTPAVSPHPRATVALVSARNSPAPRAAAKPQTHLGGAAATYAAAIAAGRHARSPIRSASHAAGVANGGAGTGAGAGRGNGGRAGTAGGIDGIGNGNGAALADVPCGYPVLIGLRAHYTGGKFYEDVDVEITFRDGHTESGRMPYLFVYNNEDENPFTDRNKDKEALLQPPPPNVDLAAAPRAVQIAVKYTRANGTTMLPACPTTPS